MTSLDELKKAGDVIAPKDQAYGPGGILGSIADKSDQEHLVL
jgi:hypothetical protein